MDCSTPGFPVLHYLPEFAQTYVHWVSDSTIPLILCRPLLLPPSIFPSIRVFSTESVLHTKWPKYWSFSLSISPSNECSGLISFRIGWLDLLAVQGTLKCLRSKALMLWHSAFFIVSHLYVTTGKTIAYLHPYMFAPQSVQQQERTRCKLWTLISALTLAHRW